MAILSGYDAEGAQEELPLRGGVAPSQHPAAAGARRAGLAVLGSLVVLGALAAFSSRQIPAHEAPAEDPILVSANPYRGPISQDDQAHKASTERKFLACIGEAGNHKERKACSDACNRACQVGECGEDSCFVPTPPSPPPSPSPPPKLDRNGKFAACVVKAGATDKKARARCESICKNSCSQDDPLSTCAADGSTCDAAKVELPSAAAAPADPAAKNATAEVAAATPVSDEGSGVQEGTLAAHQAELEAAKQAKRAKAAGAPATKDGKNDGKKAAAAGADDADAAAKDIADGLSAEPAAPAKHAAKEGGGKRAAKHAAKHAAKQPKEAEEEPVLKVTVKVTPEEASKKASKA